MAKSFEQGAEELAALVGDGTLSGILGIDGGERTVPLEVGYWQNFMGTEGHKKIENYHEGGPHAAQKALEETYAASLEDIAKTTLAEGPQAGMERHVGRARDAFRRLAPKRTGQYSESTAGFVIDGGAPVHEEYGAHYGEEPS